MGVDWTSHTILGVKLNRDKCYTTTRKPGCKHTLSSNFIDLIPDDWEFCPICGKQALIAEEVLVECLEDPGDWPIGIDQCITTDPEDYFVGRIISCDSYMEIHNMSGLKQKLKDILEPYDLWDETQFKIWNVLYC